MKILFLGTSHGVPEANRRCSCTMIEIGDKRYFVDSLVIGKVNLEPRKDKRYNFVSAIDLTGKRKSFDAEYYSFSLLFPQGSCSVSDLHLEQEISGYIDFFAWRRGSPSESAKK